VKDRIRTFFRSVQRCRLCYGPRSDIVVPQPKQISRNVRVLVVGEQPCRGPEGSNGSDAVDGGVEHLRSYLDRAGIDPSEVLYVTAVLCFPQDESLRPGRPTATETKRCSAHLRTLIERLQPKLVVPLGHTGLLAIQFAFHEWTELRQFILNYDVGAVLRRPDLAVYPLYLPSESTLKARPEGRQVKDWQKIPFLLDAMERTARAGDVSAT
jgi:uracil-DNA glycosylase family 4